MANSAFGKHTDKPQSVYNVTFGKASKRLTVFCGFVFAAEIVLCVVTSPGGIANFIAPVALLLCVIVCYGYFPRRIEVAADALTVRRRIGSKRIPLAHIINIRPYGGMGGDTWLMDTGGVMGFCGWHRGEGGKYFAYAADHRDTLLVRTARRTYAIGCGDTRALAEELARRLPGAADAAQGGADKV